jgi:hypothetical protein
MVTGRKPATLVAASEAITASRTSTAIMIVAVLACALALALKAAPDAMLLLF